MTESTAPLNGIPVVILKNFVELIIRWAGGFLAIEPRCSLSKNGIGGRVSPPDHFPLSRLGIDYAEMTPLGYTE